MKSISRFKQWLDQSETAPVEGEIRTYLDALGMPHGDARLTAVCDLPGKTTDTSMRTDADGSIELRLYARGGGAEFLFLAGMLFAVFLRVVPNEAWNAYPRPEALIEGLPARATRTQVRDMFGVPSESDELGDVFPVDDNELRFDFVDDRVSMISTVIGEKTAIGVQEARTTAPSQIYTDAADRDYADRIRLLNACGFPIDEIPDAVAELERLDRKFPGELAEMGAALGRPLKDSLTLGAMMLVGLPVVSHLFRDESGKTEHLVAEGGHAEFLFRNDVLDSIIVWTAEGPDHSAYARPDRLIDGLPGDATRAEVRSRFGDPIDTGPDVDWYPWESNFVAFVYVDDRLAAVKLMSKTPGE